MEDEEEEVQGSGDQVCAGEGCGIAGCKGLGCFLDGC